MSSPVSIAPAPAFQQEVSARGGERVTRCYQCGTCSSVCDLVTPDSVFPRRHMLLVRHGLDDRLAGDPAVWLCHQCNDCSTRCPRDARPGDLMQTLRSFEVERLAFPRFVGWLVARARFTWPLLIGLPILYWVGLLAAFGPTGLQPPTGHPFAWHDFVPHIPFVYGTYMAVAGLVVIAAGVSGLRLWREMGRWGQRSGSFLGNVVPVVFEILRHDRFETCGEAGPRRPGHFALFWGFAGAFLTTTLVALLTHVAGDELPLPLLNPVKILGNFSATLLVVGAVSLLVYRWRQQSKLRTSAAFDSFFLWVVIGVIVTGVGTEVVRVVATEFPLVPAWRLLGIWVYIAHLSTVLSMFATFPYSKFAHLLYRSLAMVHERMVQADKPGQSEASATEGGTP